MTDTRGILHPQRGLEQFTLHRYPPSELLRPYVDRLWCVSWDLADGEIFEQPILAHACVNLVIEEQRAAIYGPPTRLGRQRLIGRGWAAAVMFRPGGARPFLSGAARDWVDRTVDVVDHWGEPGDRLVMTVRAAAGQAPDVEAARVDLLQSFLALLAPADVPAGTGEVVGVAELIAQDRELSRVEDLASRTGIEVRSLQRLFAEHVGLTPKQVIRRYRLLEAAEAASAGAPGSWADVALRLGFTDQAHLTRDFTAAFGVPPARYAGG